MKRLLKILLILIVGFNYIMAKDFVKVGTTAGQFLKIEPGARALGMGACYGALANDASALYWNPAGIAQLKHSQVTFTHTRWIADITNGFAGIVMPFSGNSAVGLSIQYQMMDEMEQTTIDMPKGTGIKFGTSDVAVGLTYARAVTNFIRFGVTGKLVYQKIWNESATGLAVDMGLMLDTGIRSIRIAMVMTNFGTDMRLDGRDLIRGYDQQPNSISNPLTEAHLSTESWPLPTNFRLSVAADLIGKTESFLVSEINRVTLITDLTHPNDSKEQYNVGAEYAYKEAFFLRAGYRGNTFEEGLTLGAGLRIPLASTLELLMDYAYADFGIFNQVQHFTIGVQF